MSACPRQLPFPKPWQHIGIMRTTFVFVDFLLLATAGAQQHDESHPKGVIYGVAIGQDGQPAKGIGLTVFPLGVGLGAMLPHLNTNDRSNIALTIFRGRGPRRYAWHRVTNPLVVNPRVQSGDYPSVSYRASLSVLHRLPSLRGPS